MVDDNTTSTANTLNIDLSSDVMAGMTAFGASSPLMTWSNLFSPETTWAAGTFDLSSSPSVTGGATTDPLTGSVVNGSLYITNWIDGPGFDLAGGEAGPDLALNGAENFTLTFAEAVTEIGFAVSTGLGNDVVGYGSQVDQLGAVFQFTTNNGDTGTLTLPEGDGFVGWVTIESPTPFTSITFSEISGNAADQYFGNIVTRSAPTLVNAIADQAATEDAAFSFVVPMDTFADVDEGDSLTYAAVLDDGSALPSWLSFDPATRTFSGTPENGDVGTISVAVNVTDTSGKTSSDTFNISIANVNDAPTLSASTTTADIPENTTETGITFVAADVDDLLSAGSFVLSGVDAERFGVEGSGSGSDPYRLVFKEAPDFEAATDSGADNVYEVSVLVSDGELPSSPIELAIAVVDVDEGPPPIVGTTGDDSLLGTANDDVIDALAGDDRVSAGDGNDRVTGGEGTDFIKGGSGNDVFAATIGDGNDTYKGGTGFDTVDYSAISAPVRISLSNSATSSETGSDRLSSIENAVGGSGDDFITGTGGENLLAGGDGDDVIDGGRGSDVILGDLGNDILTGGQGPDTFVLADLDATDQITDYNFAEGDLIDFTALFSADGDGSDVDPNNNQLSDFIQLVDQGDGAVDQLQVDVDGGADSFTTVATLDGDAGVKVVFDDDGTESTDNVFI